MFMCYPKFLVAAILLFPFFVMAAPMNFDFDVSGENRPALVFTDGTDTFIQPGEMQKIEIRNAKSESRGPYVVVPGLPATIEIVVNSKRGIIKNLGVKDVAVKKSGKSKVVSRDVCSDGQANVVTVTFTGTDISEESKRVLTKLLDGYAGKVKVEVYGKKEWSTSVKRASSTASWLASHGIDPMNISTGYLTPGRNTGKALLTIAGDKSCHQEYSVSDEIPESVPVVTRKNKISMQDVDEVGDHEMASDEDLTLVMKKSDMLSTRVKAYCKKHGVRLDWKATTELRLKRDVSLAPEDGDVVGMIVDFLRVFNFEVVEFKQTIIVKDKVISDE